MRVVGIDPGMSGAAALVLAGENYQTLVAVYDIVSADGRILAGELADVLEEWNPQLVVIEAVHSMPKQGVSTTFKFGRAYGSVEGVVAALRLPSVGIAPHLWKQRLAVTRDKASARALACRLWPSKRDLFKRVKDDGRAEAALIAVAHVRGGDIVRHDVQHSAT